MRTLLGILLLAVALRANAAATRLSVEGGGWQLNGRTFSWLGHNVMLPEAKSDKRLVVGSEGGSALFADVIHFGHGPQTPYRGHLDPAFRDHWRFASTGAPARSVNHRTPENTP